MSEHRKAGFAVTLDGRDLGAEFGAGEDLGPKIGPRLISLTVTEKRGGDADQVDIVIHDHDGRMALPRKGARLRVKLGWEAGSDIPLGLVDKGSFKVDDIEWGGPPDIITIRGRSADVAADYATRREKSHRDTTIGAIVAKVAAANGLKASVAAELAGIAVPVLAQDGKSDMALVRALGRRHDARATVKNGRLIFSPIGKPATASGRAIPSATLTRRENERVNYKTVDRGGGDGVEARWHDQSEAKRKTVKAGAAANPSPSGEGSGVGQVKKPKRLKKVYATEADARHAAEAEAKRIKRAGAECDYDLSVGRPDLYPDRPVTLRGFKPEIDATAWLIAEATHTLEANGLTSKLKLETRG
ncbi:MAG TPA: phage late control D family protein [Allosphingosinicella sp.]|jgi:hypothetical protein